MDSLGGGMGGERPPGLSRDKGRRDAVPGGVMGEFPFASASMLATIITGDMVNVGDRGPASTVCPGARGVVGLASSGTVRGISCAISWVDERLGICLLDEEGSSSSDPAAASGEGPGMEVLRAEREAGIPPLAFCGNLPSTGESTESMKTVAAGRGGLALAALRSFWNFSRILAFRAIRSAARLPCVVDVLTVPLDEADIVDIADMMDDRFESRPRLSSSIDCSRLVVDSGLDVLGRPDLFLLRISMEDDIDSGRLRGPCVWPRRLLVVEMLVSVVSLCNEWR
jgi:hypothetical protein